MAPNKEAFLVNVWLLPQPSSESSTIHWRGCVEHLGTRQRRYFTELFDLVAFVATHLHKSTQRNGEEQ
ncbi:MAG TPA: hypothetical protein VMD07_05925 [Candidatus Acidoferrales bacterium]|nr:hypothetical protein [Candidatus Acidoferrales bacterium]